MAESLRLLGVKFRVVLRALRSVSQTKRVRARMEESRKEGIDGGEENRLGKEKKRNKVSNRHPGSLHMTDLHSWTRAVMFVDMSRTEFQSFHSNHQSGRGLIFPRVRKASPGLPIGCCQTGLYAGQNMPTQPVAMTTCGNGLVGWQGCSSEA